VKDGSSILLRHLHQIPSTLTPPELQDRNVRGEKWPIHAIDGYMLGKMLQELFENKIPDVSGFCRSFCLIFFFFLVVVEGRCCKIS